MTGQTEPTRLLRTLEPLPRDECLRLLASRHVGRIAFLSDDQPLVLPVNYLVQGDVVAFRTAAGAKWEHAILAAVAFEVDEIDEDRGEGWSVLVQGVARDMTGAVDELSKRVMAQPLDTWAPGDKPYWVRIVPGEITGRRLRLV